MAKHAQQQYLKSCSETYVKKDSSHHPNSWSVTKLKLEVAEGVSDNVKRKREQANATYDQHVRRLPGLQPVNPNTPWEKGLRVPKVGPRSYLTGTENRNLYRRNRKYIRQDPNQEEVQPIVTHNTSTIQSSSKAKSADRPLEDFRSTNPTKQTPSAWKGGEGVYL